MSGHKAHQSQTHMHEHGPYCGHLGVEHAGHRDYLHDGQLHHHGQAEKVELHSLEVNATNPASCTPAHAYGGHEADHEHGPGCGHEAVPHGDHRDYLVDGHLHHPCEKHCDDHGPVKTFAPANAIRPLHDRVVVECVKEADRSKGGILIPDTAKEKPTEGKVLSVGSGKVLVDGKVRKPAVSVGDRVLFGKYDGTAVKLDGAERLIIREDDILGVIDR